MSIALLVVLCLPGGCTSIKGYPARSGDIDAELISLTDYFKPETVRHASDPTLDEATRRSRRDDVVNGRLRAIDLQFGLFEQAVSREGILMNVGTDWAILGLSAAGAVIPTAGTKAILAAISGGLTGGKASIDKNVFYEKTLSVLLGKMEALRKETLVTIRHGLELPTSSYPLSQALMHVEDYYKGGTIPGAILGIAATAGATAAAADKELKSIVEVKYTAGGPTRPIRDRVNRWLDAAPGINVPALRAWLRGQTPPISLSPGSWVESPSTTPAMLQKVIDELHIPQ